jgi:hypothetical protein
MQILKNALKRLIVNNIGYLLTASLCIMLGMMGWLQADDGCYAVEECNLEPEPTECIWKTGRHQLYVGPEFAYVNRLREGGTRQKGLLYGGRVGYDHIKRFKFYWGFEGWFGSGRLHGKSSNDNRLRSNFTDTTIEGRFGYTFQQKCGYRISLTPFIGGGYVLEKNNFIRPSPLKVHFRLHYYYGCAGFLSQATILPRFDIGLNFKAFYPYDGRNKVTHDPEHDSQNMLFKERWMYRLELPLTYHWRQDILLRLDPFYEYREYGKHANYPFDFLETKLRFYGATLKFVYCL